MSKNIISTTKLCKSFPSDGIDQIVLRDLDLEIREGDFTIIMGSSGSGKTTLLYAISGIDKPTSGIVTFCGEQITDYSNDELAVFRRKNCGFVFQENHLIAHMDAKDNVLTCGLLLSGNKKALNARAAELFGHVGLDTKLWNRFPSQLSGGEAQRVGIVRALINDPAVLFADEPTGSLNSSASTTVLDTMNDLHRNGQSIVMVTHDLKTAVRGNRILYVRDGVVFGELLLDCYNAEDESVRLDALQGFLDSMGW
ncbi:MAG: ABC transporter ATP-binding protein [Actinomycetia bacterium]|nr:ABC transporter ATP-binding protein [Actinomycetes bacterium]